MHNTKLRLGVAAAAVVASLSFAMPAAQAGPSVTSAPATVSVSAPTAAAVQDGGDWGGHRFHHRGFFNRGFFGGSFFGGGFPIVVTLVPGFDFGFPFGGFGGFGTCGFSTC